MLLEMAVADAYAIAFEFTPHTADRPNTLDRYYQHPTYADMVPGCYTDDTQRSIANARLLLNCYPHRKDTPSAYNPIDYIEAYQLAFTRDPRPGYSRRYEQFLRENCTADPVQFALKLDRKPTNGAVMGAAALGWLNTPEQVMLAAAAQAISTHSYQTVPYAQMVALSAHYMIHGIGPRVRLTNWLYDLLHRTSKDVENFLAAADEVPTKPTTMHAASVVKLMLWAVPRSASLTELVRLAVQLGGDTDSAAAVMVAVASESEEYVNDLPAELVDGLEDGDYGKPYLARLDEQLRDRHRRGQAPRTA